MGLGGVISNLQSLGAKLLPFVSTSTQAASSSSAPPVEGHEIETDLKRLMKMLEWIEANLYDAEERVIRDRAVKLWLKELKKVAYDAEDVLDEYHYEVLRAQVEARNASPPNPHKWKQVQVPDDMFSKIKEIMGRFDEIERDRLKLRLFHEDAPRRADTELQIVPTSHFITHSNIFGREREKEDLIDLLSSECHDGNIISVVTIVGTGGLGKTTLAQLVYNDDRIKQRFDKFGWVCVSEDFNVQRLTREVIESITTSTCALENLSALQNKISGELREKSVLLILDDVWNENITHWENFQAPFQSAAMVKILVTTRNEPVAQIMQTVPSFKLGYLSQEQCWHLFQHYAFGQANQNACSKMVEIGKQIMKKCGGLPLAVKSIACLLRHEKEEESWREILESELWESDASKEIFPSLQISYSRLPTHLKPCFLFCSIFPRDCSFMLEELVQLWTSHGYLKSNGKKSSKKIGMEYAKQLWQRSFLEGQMMLVEQLTCPDLCKLHDVVHDLARFNSNNGFYSIETGKVSNFPEELYHLYVDYNVTFLEPLPSFKVTNLRTLIIKSKAESDFYSFEISKAQKLRALEIRGPFQVFESEVASSNDNFKHLRYLYLHEFSFGRLPKFICSLYNLKILTVHNCYLLQELPENIGNLVSLEELTIVGCDENLRVFPESFCQLRALKRLEILHCLKLQELPTDFGKLINLRTLNISDTNISCLPSTISNLIESIKIDAWFRCKTIGWLKDLVDVRGTLCLDFLAKLPNSTDVQCAPLVRMHNLEYLELSWCEEYSPNLSKRALHLTIEGNHNISPENDFALMVTLQPHPNLRELYISGYRGFTFPEWIRNPSSSLSTITIRRCKNIVRLPFDALCKLKHLVISDCSSLWFLGADSLPHALLELRISKCGELKSISGIGKLKSLVRLSIEYCWNLQCIMDAEPSHVELMMPTIKSSYQNSLLGLRNLTSLRSSNIFGCSNSRMNTDELPPVESCKVTVSYCPGLREWCLQHNFSYKG